MVCPLHQLLTLLPIFLQIRHLVATSQNTEAHYGRTHIPKLKCLKVTSGLGFCYLGLRFRLKQSTFQKVLVAHL